MVMGWDDLAVGGLSAAGGIIGGLISNQNSRSNADHAWAQQMEASNTAHQREVEDLRKAGLNPILSAGGSGASSPSASTSDSADFSGVIGSGINTALAKEKQKQEIENLKATAKLTGQQGSMLSQQFLTESANRSYIQSQRDKVKSDTEFQYLKNRFMRETLEAQIKEAKARGDWAQVNMLLGAIGGTTKAIGNVIP